MEVPTQTLVEALPFYIIGYFGLLLKVLRVARQEGKTLAAIGKYVRENSLDLLIYFVSYNGLIALWYTTDLLSWAGAFKGYLTGMTIVIALVSDKIVEGYQSEAMDKITERFRREKGE